MAFRTFCRLKIQSTGVPQPLVGSWISACAGIGVAPSFSPLAATLGNMANAGNDATQIFVGGDPLWLIDPNSGVGANPEPARCQSVAGNVLTLGPMTDVLASGQHNPYTRYPHVAGAFGAALGNGTFVLLRQQVNNLYIQPEDAATGPFFFVGNQINFTANFRRIVKIAVVGVNAQPIAYNASEASAGNPFDTSELWIIGTANDTYSVSFNQV